MQMSPGLGTTMQIQWLGKFRASGTKIASQNTAQPRKNFFFFFFFSFLSFFLSFPPWLRVCQGRVDNNSRYRSWEGQIPVALCLQNNNTESAIRQAFCQPPPKKPFLDTSQSWSSIILLVLLVHSLSRKILSPVISKASRQAAAHRSKSRATR